MAENEINKVQVLIRRFLFEVDGIIHDPSACQAWLQSFCKTLQFQDLCKEPNQYALFLLDEARAFNIEQRRKSQMKQVRRALTEDGIKNPTQEQLDEKWLEMYGQENSPQDAPNGNAGVDMYDAGNGAASKSPTSCDTFTADGDIREDSQAKPDGSAITRNETRAHDALEPSANQFTADASTREGEDERDNRGNTGTLESSTSANIYGDAATREGAEVVDSRESGAAAPTTVSGQFRGSAKNQGESNTSSTVPAVCPESGDISKARQGQARESRRAGGNSLRVEKVSTPPARSAGPMPEDKQAVYDFAAAEGLDTADAYECWHVTVNERGGLTADGKPVKNWKAYVRKWCETRESRRNQ